MKDLTSLVKELQESEASASERRSLVNWAGCCCNEGVPDNSVSVEGGDDVLGQLLQGGGDVLAQLLQGEGVDK